MNNANILKGILKQKKMFRLQPPENFDFEDARNWSVRHQRFQDFRIVSNLSEELADIQMSILAYCMETEAEQIYKSLFFKIKEDEKILT